ncbi:Gti1/Pac2 family-domain-containing protein [Mycena belliarum]|uniref:Gti1/Pac2 family-domain-containing protein n=1 Tax=Mycena belliarum TaxID=1033014 RepID=A0AAD6XKT2_9AGAR|nr:Gti1/Pac2 family-domain-containing protein [Mycena belliae]
MSGTGAPAWTEPPWSGWIETTGDALLILEAARRGFIPRATRRLVDAERRMITSGSVFVFDEDESGIKRWTDGCFWSPSRTLGNFLLYRETVKKGTRHECRKAGRDGSDDDDGGAPGESLSRPRTEGAGTGVDRQNERALLGSLTSGYKFKADGLMKKTFSVPIAGTPQHLISYYKITDVASGRLRAPSSLPELASLDIAAQLLAPKNFRVPPKTEVGLDGVPRYRGEADELVAAGVDLGMGVGAGLGAAGSRGEGGGGGAGSKRRDRERDREDGGRGTPLALEAPPGSASSLSSSSLSSSSSVASLGREGVSALPRSV